jgi:uncharacterized membrane protein YdjX (TVP38/TMEM64 family)
MVSIVMLLFAAGTALRRTLGLDLDVESVRAFAEGLGPAAPILFVALVAGRAFLALPSQVVLIVAGLCFGTFVGALVGGCGLMISGLALFLMARYAGRAEIEQRLGPRFGRLLDLAGRRAGALALVLGCAYPIAPLSPIQAAAGLTPMTIPLFVVGAFTGSFVRAATFAYFGDAIVGSSLTALLGATLAFLTILLIPVTFPRGRAWLHEWAQSDEGASAGPPATEAVRRAPADLRRTDPQTASSPPVDAAG